MSPSNVLFTTFALLFLTYVTSSLAATEDDMRMKALTDVANIARVKNISKILNWNFVMSRTGKNVAVVFPVNETF